LRQDLCHEEEESTMSDAKELSPLEAAEAKRAARKAKAQEAADAQKAIDTEAIDAIEASLGDSAIKAIDIPFRAGLVSKVAVRCPSKPEINRYRDRVKPQRDRRNVEVPGDAAAAHEEIGAVCVVYPDKEQFAKVCEVLPGLLGQCGMHAVALSVGEEEKAGKD
jgi:hypothetical protein